MKHSRLAATCGMTAALCVVVMLIGGILGIGMYVSPMIAGVCLIPVGRQFGRKYHALLWLAVSILCFILVPNVEANLMFLTLFGVYPLLQPLFQRLPVVWRWACKLLFFNVVFAAVEALVMLVLVPEAMPPVMVVLLLAVGNLTFILYDRLLPRMELLLQRRFSRWGPRR